MPCCLVLQTKNRSEPNFFVFFLKRPHVDIQLNLEFSFEILWYLPQVPPACAASAVFEFAGFENFPCFVQDSEFCPGDAAIVFCYGYLVLFSSLADDGITYR